MKWAGTPDWFYPFDCKRPDQIQHRLGKAWLFVAWHLKSLASNEKITYFKTEDHKFHDADNSLPIPDGYCVIEHPKLGKRYMFGEFQVTTSANKWNKKYAELFKSFSVVEPITLTIVTTEDNEPLRKQLHNEISSIKNVRVEFLTLDKLRDYCWRIALQLREKHRKLAERSN